MYLKVPSTLEIALVPKKTVPAQYPGLYLFTNAARMMRPVMNLAAQKVELVGTFEQVYLEICVTPEEAYKGVNIYNLHIVCIFCSSICTTKIYLFFFL